jgi:hypothetical protein
VAGFALPFLSLSLWASAAGAIAEAMMAIAAILLNVFIVFPPDNLAVARADPSLRRD